MHQPTLEWADLIGTETGSVSDGPISQINQFSRTHTSQISIGRRWQPLQQPACYGATNGKVKQLPSGATMRHACLASTNGRPIEFKRDDVIQLIRIIGDCANKMGFKPFFVHIRGKDNLTADALY
eukprot:149581_1